MSREMLEWFHCESWKGDKKVLCIGDSIVWGSHKMLEGVLPEGVALTTIVSSFGVNDGHFVNSHALQANIDGMGYELVYFNNGLHPHGQTADEYEANYRKTICEMMAAIPSKKWILGLSTPISEEPGDPTANSVPVTDRNDSPWKKKNDLVIEYNKRVCKIAKELGLDCYDAYTLMETQIDRKIDPYHYNEEGRRFFAEAIGKLIINNIDA